MYFIHLSMYVCHVVYDKQPVYMMENNNIIKQLENEIAELRQQLSEKEEKLSSLKHNSHVNNPYCNILSADEISRYSRQMIMPQITLKGQEMLKKSRVLVVGAGGLGCPASLYLTAAGVGNITLLDNDHVELSNLHRQILHAEYNIGLPKVKSAQLSLNRLNRTTQVNTLHMHLNSGNVSNLLAEYDVIVDGTDNVATRYLLNDACVLQKKPLVSGSALQFDGQLTVYNYEQGPCYRCLFPKPPPPETVTSCGDGGVLGVVPGCIGVLQALETIKILLRLPDVLSGRMLLFDASNTTFRNVTLRKRNPKCQVCGLNAIITAPIDYEQFCQGNAHDKGDMISILATNHRISVHDYYHQIKDNEAHILLDVRSETEFEMCHLPNSINIPFTVIQTNQFHHHEKMVHFKRNMIDKTAVYVVCRRGNDSQRAVNILQHIFHGSPYKFKDIQGGLHAYSMKIDSQFPIY